MNESMVYGAPINSKPVADSINFNVGYEKTQLALFKLRPELITNRGNWWLRCVVSSTNFANVNSTGNANNNNASNSNGVRPDFTHAGKTLQAEHDSERKGNPWET